MVLAIKRDYPVMHTEPLSLKSSGYVLLAMLALLLGVGGGWITIAAPVRQGAASSLRQNVHERQSLANARQALVSYSVLYPFMYGPAGAGPGHFPCPDTDGYSYNGAAIVTAMEQGRDGPNPPCNAWSGSAGKFPRHVVLPGHRYIFHAQPRQLYEYQVAGDVVNNPLNRVVNLSDMLVRSSASVAQISSLAVDAERVSARVVVTHHSLADATAASVAGWVIHRLVQSDDTPLDVSALCVENSIEPLLLDKPIILDDQCIEDSLAMNTIEGVPALRHWFIRNKWHNMVELQGRQACQEAVSAPQTCKPDYSLEMRKAMRVNGLITLVWSPAS